MICTMGLTPWILGLFGGGSVEPGQCLVDGGEHVNNQPWDHVKGHQGKYYEVCQYTADVGTNEFIEFILEPDATKNAHAFWELNSEGSALVEYKQNITSRGAGTAVTPSNIHEGFPDASVVTVVRTPIADIVGGDIKCQTFFPAAGVGQSSGAGGGRTLERVVKKSGRSSFKAINLEATDKRMSFKVFYYESDE